MSSLANRVAMTTPVKSTPKKPIPLVDSPGTWRHPRLDEITRRRNATTFSEKNVRRISYNFGCILVLWVARHVATSYSSPQLISSSLRTYLSWTFFIIQLLPWANIGIALLPLFRPADNLSDIPLTPAQRQLLGLPPSSGAQTPDAVYSTPPRYSRTPSLAGSVASKGSYTSSPLSGRGSPVVGSVNGSPFSAVNSPSRFTGGLNGNRRSSLGSLGSPSPRGATTATNLFPDPATPSPSVGKRTSVGLNNKWLYERGRRSSGSTWLH